MQGSVWLYKFCHGFGHLVVTYRVNCIKALRLPYSCNYQLLIVLQWLGTLIDEVGAAWLLPFVFCDTYPLLCTSMSSILIA